MISIYDIETGSVKHSLELNEGCIRRFKLMEEDHILLKFSTDTLVTFKTGDYVDFHNQSEHPDLRDLGRFEYTGSEYFPKYNDETAGFDYELQLDNQYYKWKNHIFKYIPDTGGAEASWTLTAKAYVFMDVFLSNLTHLNTLTERDSFDYKADDTHYAYTYNIYSKFADKEITLTFSNSSLFDGLTAIAEQLECDWWIDANTIIFGRCEDWRATETRNLTLGDQIERYSSSEGKLNYSNKLYVFGSQRNITKRYRRKLTLEGTYVGEMKSGSLLYSIFPLKSLYYNYFYPDDFYTTKVVPKNADREGDVFLYKATFQITGELMYGAQIVALTANLSVPDKAGQTIYWNYKARMVVHYSNGTTKESALYPTSGTYTERQAITLSDSGTGRLNYSFPLEVQNRTIATDVIDFTIWFQLYKDTTTTGFDSVATIATRNLVILKKALTDNFRIPVPLTVLPDKSHADAYFDLTDLDYGGRVKQIYLPSQEATAESHCTFEFQNINRGLVPLDYFSPDSENSFTKAGVVVKRLMLPEDTKHYTAQELEDLGDKAAYFVDEKGRGFVMKDYDLPEERVIETVAIDEEIYPSYEDEVEWVDVKVETDTNDDGETTNTYNYTFKTKKFKKFSEAYLLENQDFMAVFGANETTSEGGLLNGLSFKIELATIERETAFKIVVSDDYSVPFPNDVSRPTIGDKVTFINYDVAFVSDELVFEAEKRLLLKGYELLEQLNKDLRTYEIGLFSDYAVEVLDAAGGDVSSYFREGDKVLVKGGTFNNWQSRVIGYEFPLDIPYDSPVLICGETDTYSRLQALEAKLEERGVGVVSVTQGGGGAGVNVKTSTSSQRSTDENVYSALRTDMEIENALAKKESETDEHYLIKDDASLSQNVQGNVSFMKGVGVQQKLTVGGDIEVNGTAGLHGDVFIGDALEVGDGAEIGGDLGVVGNTTLGGTTHSAGNVTVGTVTTSLLPGTTSGVVLGSDGKILAKSLELSESLVVPEIRYNRATTIVGTEWRTQGGGIIESVTQDTATTGHGTLRLEDGEAGAIMEDDLCIGIWHNIDGGNATADYDSRTGNFTFKGFQTIYFQIEGVSGANSQNFTYKLRQGYTFHPQAGMHFAAYTNIGATNKVGRQSFTYETKDYQVSLRDVTDWTWSENNIYYVRGKLAGFTVGTTTFPADSTETGLILGNIYFSGTIRNIEANIRSVSVTQTKGGWVDTSETDEVTIRLVDGNGENKSDEVDTCTCTSGGSSVPVTTLYDGSTKIGFRVLAQNITAVKTYDVTLTCSDGRVFTAAFAEHPSPTRGENAVMYQLIATPDLLGLDKDENITPGTTIQFRVLKLDGNTKTYLSVTQCRTEGLKLQYGATTWAITTASDLQFTWQKTINQLTFKLLDSSNAELAEKTVKMIKDGETGAAATFTTWQLYPSADSVSVDKSGSSSRQGFIVSVRKVTESGMTSYGVNNLPQDVSIRYVVNAISSSKDSQLIYAENNGSGVEKYNSYYDGTSVVNVPTTSTVANKIVGNNDTYGLAVSVPNTLAVPSGNTFITFSLWLGNTLYDTKTVPFFKDGQDGENAIRLDSDNDMDAIPTDSTGEVVNGFSISTHLVLFDGSTPVSSGITAPTPASLVIGTGEDDRCTPTVSMTSGLIAITWTFGAGDTFHSERYEVPISVQYGGKTYTSTFTAVVVKSGEQGVAPTLYQLQPNPSRVSFSKGSNNTLTPATITLKCGYTKNVGGTITSSEGVSVDGYKIYYRYKSATGWGAFQNLTTGGLSIARTTTYTDVEFVLSSSSAASSVANTNIIDRETVPITKDGLDGTSVTVSSNSTQYAASTSGTDAPSTGWQDSVPDVAKGAFLWTRVTTTYSDGTTATSYGVSYRGTDGTSPSISSTEIRYASSTSGTTTPTSGWQSTIPSVAQGGYLWTRTRVTYATASGTTTTTSYSVARAGADGDTGNPGTDGYTTHFAYSTSADGSQNFSVTNFDGATYIGAYRDQNEADSTDYTKYTWTRWRGVDGENVIHVDLDNENDAMLYDGSGNLISGSVTSNASLYDGTTKVSSGVTWTLPTKTNCTATITTAGVVTVTAMSATTGKVVVRATYKSKTYDATLSLKKLIGTDKYELICTPNSVTYNTTTGNLSASAITIRVYKTAQNGTRTNISTLPSNYILQGSETFSRAYSGGYATMPVNSSLSSMSVTLKDASGVVLDNETIPINKSTNGANGNDGKDGKDAQPIRPNIIANGREERYITGTTNSNYPINPSYSETSSGVTYSVFYGWRHLEIDYTQGERVIVSMNLRWNGLTAVSGASMRVRILMFTGSGNPTIFYKAITTASGEGRFESSTTPTSASGRYLCRVELAGCSAGTIWYSDVKAEIADDNTSTATPWMPCAHDYAGVNPNILDYTKDGKNTEGNLMWVQSIVNQGVMTIKEDDFALNNPVSYVDAASLSSTQTAIRDEGIVTIPASQPCIVSWDACYVGTEPYRWWLQLLDVNSSSHINIHYYCLGTSDSSYIIGAGKHLRQQTTNDEGWQRFFVYLDPVSSQRQFKVQFKHDGRNGDGTTSALHIRRVKVELSYFPTPWVISEDDKMGAAGLPGKDAVPAVYAGEWSSSAIYYYDDVRREIVLYNGHYYAVKTQGTTCTSADIPGSSSEKWEAFSGEFRSVATDVLLSEDVLASRGRFDGLVVDNLTATNSDFQDVVIRGVLSKMKTTITAAELGSTIAYKKYTALSHQGVLPWSSQANYLNVWRCGDVVDIDCGTTVCKLVLPTAWHATTNGSGTQISPSPTNYADGDFSFASGHGFLLTPNSTVRSYPSIDDIRGLVGRKMVFRNKSNTAEVYICAHRYKRLTSPNEQGDSTVVNYEDGLVVIGKLNIGEMLQVECCVDFVIGNPYSYEGYHWEFFGKGIKYL